MTKKRDIAFALRARAGWTDLEGDEKAFDDGKIERLRTIANGHCPADRLDELIVRARLAFLSLKHSAKDQSGAPVSRRIARDKLARVATAVDQLESALADLGDDLRNILESEAWPFLRPNVRGINPLSFRLLKTLLPALRETADKQTRTLNSQRLDKPAEYAFARALAEAWHEATGKKPGISNNQDAVSGNFQTPFQMFVAEAGAPKFKIGRGILLDAVRGSNA